MTTRYLVYPAVLPVLQSFPLSQLTCEILPASRPSTAAICAARREGLSPAMVTTSALDCALDHFFDENVKYAVRFVTAGVPNGRHFNPDDPGGDIVAADAIVSERALAFKRIALPRGLDV
jgi:hypothetical protein